MRTPSRQLDSRSSRVDPYLGKSGNEQEFTLDMMPPRSCAKLKRGVAEYRAAVLPVREEGFLPVNKPVIYLLIDFREFCKYGMVW